MISHFELLMLTLALTLHRQAQSGKIVGGRVALPHSRPYMAYIELRQDNKTRGHCGGFLLNEDFVMTAAHCKAKTYIVSLGLHDVTRNDQRQDILVKQDFPSKEYNETYFWNDIMLLKLSSKAKFSSNVKPIAVAEKDGGSLPASCSVAGWGRTDRNSTFTSSVLREINVTLIDNKICKANNFYCSKGEDGMAQGDSGGPLVCEDGKAYGVVSNRYPAESINMYTKIPDYRNWIHLTMKYAQSRSIH